MEAVIEDRDAAGTLASLARLRRVRVEAERDVFLSVAHFADLCHADSMPRVAAREGRVFTGMERAWALEWAAAQLWASTIRWRRPGAPPTWVGRCRSGTRVVRACGSSRRRCFASRPA